MSQDQPRRTDQGRGQDQGGDGGGGQEGGGGGQGRLESGHVAMWTEKITIGEALETAGRAAADKPVDRADAAAIAAAEATATGLNVILPGGVAAAAHLAADANTWVAQDDYKAKLGDVLGDAMTRLPADKEVTREDAVRVASAEIRSTPNLETRSGGVASTVRAAAKLNEDR